MFYGVKVEQLQQEVATAADTISQSKAEIAELHACLSSLRQELQQVRICKPMHKLSHTSSESRITSLSLCLAHPWCHTRSSQSLGTGMSSMNGYCQGPLLHLEIQQYHQSTGEAHAKVLENLTVYRPL